MPRRKPQEIHVNHERWLVSYADFITLLFAFFVVMYSVSQVNQGKYRILAQTMEQAFNVRPDPSTSANGSAPVNSGDLVAPVVSGTVPNQQAADTAEEQSSANEHSSAESVDTESTQDETVEKSDAKSDETAKGEESANETTTTADNSEFKSISSQVTEKFAQLIDDKLIKVSSNDLWLQIELKDSILFSSGGVEPSGQARAIFTEIADILLHYSNPIQIEGYTDNIPISNSRYPTNWELSATRATEIVKFLVTKGVAPERLAAVGYGEFQPVASNTTEAGRAQNRRVAVMVAKRKLEKPKSGE